MRGARAGDCDSTATRGAGRVIGTAVAENQPGSGSQNRMNEADTILGELAARSRGLMRPTLDGRPGRGIGEEAFGALALDLFAAQFAHNPAYRRLCQYRGVAPAKVTSWRGIPAVPTSAFKECELTCLSPERRERVFYSSGTTGQRPSRHFHDAQSLALYEASVWPWFAEHLLPESGGPLPALVALTPPPALAPHSSLVHMLATVGRMAGEVAFLGGIDPEGAWELSGERVLAAVTGKAAAGPVLILGTAFNFVHWLDYLAAGGVRLRLPAGSRVMETGGYKGRSRVVPKAELHAAITDRLGVAPECIVCEYGMSELGSQAYDGVAGRGGPGGGRLGFPPWARAVVVSPETGAEVAEGETGLIRVFDLANVWSVMAVQTEDLGGRRGAGFELLGRATPAEPRGCSLQSI